MTGSSYGGFIENPGLTRVGIARELEQVVIDLGDAVEAISESGLAFNTPLAEKVFYSGTGSASEKLSQAADELEKALKAGARKRLDRQLRSAATGIADANFVLGNQFPFSSATKRAAGILARARQRVTELAGQLYPSSTNPYSFSEFQYNLLGNVSGLAEEHQAGNMREADKWLALMRGMLLTTTEGEDDRLRRQFPRVMQILAQTEADRISPGMMQAALHEAGAGYERLRSRLGFEYNPVREYTLQTFKRMDQAPEVDPMFADNPRKSAGITKAKVEASFRKHFQATKDEGQAWNLALEELAGPYDPDSPKKRHLVSDFLHQVSAKVALEEGDPYRVAVAEAMKDLKKEGRLLDAIKETWQDIVREAKAQGEKEDDIEHELYAYLLFDDEGNFQRWLIDHSQYFQGHSGPTAMVYVHSQPTWKEVQDAIEEELSQASVEWKVGENPRKKPTEKLQADGKLHEIYTGHYYATKPHWVAGLEDEEEIQLALYIEVTDMYEATREEKFEDVPYVVEASIIVAYPGPTALAKADAQSGSATGNLGDVYGYMGGVPVTDVLMEISAPGGQVGDIKKFNSGTVWKTEVAHFGSVAARRGRRAKFTSPIFTDEETALRFAEELLRRADGLFMLVGFTLDQPINLAGDDGWRVIRDQVKGAKENPYDADGWQENPSAAASTAPAAIFKKLKQIAPNIAFSVSHTADPYHSWDGEGPDPRDEGFSPYDVEVTARAIVYGEEVQGQDTLGGSYDKPGEFDPDLYGYLPQMLREAVDDLAKQRLVVGSLLKQAHAASKYLKEVMRKRYEEQKTAANPSGVKQAGDFKLVLSNEEMLALKASLFDLFDSGDPADYAEYGSLAEWETLRAKVDDWVDNHLDSTRIFSRREAVMLVRNLERVEVEEGGFYTDAREAIEHQMKHAGGK